MSPPPALSTFDEAVRTLPAKQKVHLLLGNGFSQAWDPKIFSYGSLLEKADLSDSSKAAFSALGTKDFESVIKTLCDAAKLIDAYSEPDTDLSNVLKEDAKKIKLALVETISKHHPPSTNTLDEAAFKHCRAFLRNFERIYSLNYDLLLYWSLLHVCEGEEAKDEIRSDDGFRHPAGEESDVDYVSWEIDNTYNQTIFYLHGALHLFNSGPELKKFTWSRTGQKLMAQINEALDNEMYPMIVAEGTSDEKMERIMQSGYLQRGLKSLASITGTLFAYGLSFSANDTHVLNMVLKSKCTNLWVSIYDDPSSPPNKAIIARALDLSARRPASRKLTVNFFCANSARVWR